MKKAVFILASILCGFVSLKAQKIKFESSFETAKNMALKQKKPLAILITIQPPVPAPDYMKGLDDITVVNKFNSSFINYKVAREDTNVSRKITREYRIYRFPSIIFLDHKGGLLFSDVAFLSRAKSLLDVADKAMAALSDKSLVDYDSAYNAGNKSTAFLKSYILKRRNAGITDNADLIETYVSGLSVSDLNNYDEVLFILKAGPVLDSIAYRLAWTNRSIVNNIYKTEPPADRAVMNGVIGENTMRKAIAGKNYARAVAVANFYRGSGAGNSVEGQKRWHLKMLQYYIGVKDTASYLLNASFYYDNYYMKMSIDSVRKRDSLSFEAAKNRARQNPASIINDTIIKQSFSFTYSKDRYATDLNNAAWNFYKFAGNNTDYLSKAMLWSKRSVDYSPKPAFYDTFAHLLYKLKFYAEAEKMQKLAIETGKAAKADTRVYEEEYKKIKNKTL
jgi:hypothetical protein